MEYEQCILLTDEQKDMCKRIARAAMVDVEQLYEAMQNLKVGSSVPYSYTNPFQIIKINQYGTKASRAGVLLGEGYGLGSCKMG